MLLTALATWGALGGSCDSIPQTAIDNLGLAVLEQALGDGLLLTTVLESEQSASDLNGDGDTLDAVAFVYDFARNELLSSGISTFKGLSPLYHELESAGGRAAFRALESGQGVDLNGDGDLQDKVVQVYESSTGNFVNTGLAARAFELQEGGLIVEVAEVDQDQDLNGDGDKFDLVTFAGVSGDALFPTGFDKLFARPGVILEGSFLFQAYEANHGATDLNGDGDSLDFVLHVLNLTTGNVTNLAVDSPGDLGTLGQRFATAVDEAAQGGDLNGDGDAVDLLPLLINPTTLATTLIDLEVSGRVLASGSTLLFPLAENGVDLNGDGDTNDPSIMHLFDLRLGVVKNLGVCGGVDQVGETAGSLRVFETCTGQDLNGDTLLESAVVSAYSRTTGEVANFATAFKVTVGDGVVAFKRPETVTFFEQPPLLQDLNGDGDFDDRILDVFDGATGTLVSTGLAVAPPTGSFSTDGDPVETDAGYAYASVSEKAQKTDLNGDGDKQDLLLYAVNANGPVPCPQVGTAVVDFQIDGEHASFLEDEARLGQDLNGDGDEQDFVLQILGAR